MNLLTLIVFRIDKQRAREGKSDSRISEATLMKLGFAGGSIGGLVGIHHLRHKSQKMKFKLGFIGFVLTNIGMYYLIIQLYLQNL